MYYDRYSSFKNNGKFKLIPNLILPFIGTDITDVYKQGVTRLDILSQKYYNNPYYGVLILMANPSLASIEFDIKDGETIRIPYPLQSAIDRYNEAIRIYNILYGN
jgi:hypothetical protein